MAKIRWAVLGVTVVAAAAVVASACTTREASSSGPGTMRVGLGAPARPTPGSGINYVVSAMTTEPWLTNQPNGRVADRVVREWTWDEAGTTLFLKLRNGVRFHDGTLLTAPISAEALQLAVKGAEAPSLSTVQSIRALDNDTVALKLSEPNSFLLSDLSLVSVRQPGDPKGSIGTGPFRVLSRTEEQVVLEAFPQYYRGRPALQQIVLRNYPTQRNAWAALMRGQIDMLFNISREAVDFVAAETTIKTYSSPNPYYTVLAFNERHPILKNREVRRALNYALDKTALVRDGLRGHGRPADGPLVPEHWAYAPPPDPFVYDPAAARARLDAAGFPMRPGTGGRMPSRLSFTCIVVDDPRFERLAILVQKQLADIGVDMVLEPWPMRDFVGRVQTGEFDAFLVEMAGHSLNWVYDFWRSRENGRAITGYTSANAVLDRIRTARTDEEVKAGVVEMVRILHEDPPAAFLAWQQTFRAVSERFDVGSEPDRDIVRNLWQWRVAPTSQRAAR